VNYNDFVPAFRTDVFVDQPGPNATDVNEEVNPLDCATAECAFNLAVVLGQNGYPCAIVPGPALGGFTDVFKGGDVITSTVPWLKFVDGTVEIAGQLAAFWQRFKPYSALQHAIRDIQVAAFDQGISTFEPTGDIPSEPPAS